MQLFENLNLHQKLKFLHDLSLRIEPYLPQRDFSFINTLDASDLELLRMNTFFRCIAWADAYENVHILGPIYKKFCPNQSTRLPDRMRCKSILVLLTVRLFNQYSDQVSDDRIISAVAKAMQIWEALNADEIALLPEVITFLSNHNQLLFKFHDQQFKCQLNPLNGYGYELTLKTN